jgi:acyl-CoA thioesterase 8
MHKIPNRLLLDDSPYQHSKKTRQWIKAEGRISDEGGHHAHLAALAYMSDQYFIGTVSRVHKLWRIPVARHEHKEVKVDEDVQKSLRNGDLDEKPAKPDKPKKQPKPIVSMMVSLDHTIYFHDPRAFRADEWLFTEMESPWAGDGRGLVIQRTYTQSGKLIASCIQEVSEICSIHNWYKLTVVGGCSSEAKRIKAVMSQLDLSS